MVNISATKLSAPVRQRPLMTGQAWLWVCLLGAAFVAMHWFFIARMARIAWEDKNWSHALVIPLISIYFISQHREQLLRTERRLFWPGLLVLLLALFSYTFWMFPGRNDMMQGYSLVMGVFGLVLFLLGPAMMRILWFPVCYLALAVKVSPKLWDIIAWKLQNFAAQASVVAMQMIGFFINMEAESRGSMIHLTSNGQPLPDALNVAEACAGLRMLAAFIALGVAVAFLSPRSWWQRLIMVALTIPIAVLVNVGRVTTLGILAAKVDPELASGDFHTMIGMLMLIPALGLFLLVGWILDRIVIDDSATVRRARPAAAPLEDDDRQVDMPPAGLLVQGALLGVGIIVVLSLAYGATLMSVSPSLRVDWLGPTVVSLSAVLLAAGSLGYIWFARHQLKRLAGTTPGRPVVLAAALCVGLLASSALAKHVVLSINHVVMFKKPVPLRMSLERLPHVVGDYAYDDATRAELSKEVIEELGTTEFITRVYVDRSKPAGEPGSRLVLHVAYYTGTADTVPHVPTRCYTASGVLPLNTIEQTLALNGAGYTLMADGRTRVQLADQAVTLSQRDVAATTFTYGHAQDSDFQSNVLYFFAANGKFLPTPELVRTHSWNPADEYAYYCKIEVNLPGVGDRAEAARLTSRFLSVMLPRIMACLPDWQAVQAGEYPPSADSDS